MKNVDEVNNLLKSLEAKTEVAYENLKKMVSSKDDYRLVYRQIAKVLYDDASNKLISEFTNCTELHEISRSRSGIFERYIVQVIMGSYLAGALSFNSTFLRDNKVEEDLLDKLKLAIEDMEIGFDIIRDCVAKLYGCGKYCDIVNAIEHARSKFKKVKLKVEYEDSSSSE